MLPVARPGGRPRTTNIRAVLNAIFYLLRTGCPSLQHALCSTASLQYEAFQTSSKRADFLRSFGLARLPKNSIVCTRASEMLLAQHRPELARAAVDKALLADPTDLPASVFNSRFKVN
jgi:transposase